MRLHAPSCLSARVRGAGLVFAGFAGAGLGLALALTVRLHDQGDDALALLAFLLGVVINLGAIALLLLFRAVDQLLQRPDPGDGMLARRIALLEARLAVRDDVARPAAPSQPASPGHPSADSGKLRIPEALAVAMVGSDAYGEATDPPASAV